LLGVIARVAERLADKDRGAMRGSGRKVFSSTQRPPAPREKAVRIVRADLTFSNFSIVRLSIPPHCVFMSDLPAGLCRWILIIYLVDQMACSKSARSFATKKDEDETYRWW